MTEIEPQVKKYCTLVEALEYLAFNRLPYQANDVVLVDHNFFRCEITKSQPEREKCLSDKEYEYKKGMYYARAGLENILRKNSEIELFGVTTINIINSHNIILDKKKDEVEYFDIFNSMKHPNIDEVLIFGDYDFHRGEYFPDEVRYKNVCGTVIYKNPCLDFEQIKGYKLPRAKSNNITNAIDDSVYTTDEIQLINALIRDDDVIPLLSKRGKRNISKLVDKVNDYGNSLGLKKKLTDNKIRCILSVIKSPKASKAGLISKKEMDS